VLIEISAPASLPLGLVQLASEAGPKTCLLGVTLQHPPVNLFAQAYLGGFKVTGARADVAYEQGERFLQYHQLERRAEVEVELAIPSLVGLGSEPMLGLSMAQALSWLNNLPLDNTLALAQALDLRPQNALEVWGFAQGGLLLVDVSGATHFQSVSHLITPPLRRYEITHPEKEAWAFVLLLPRIPNDTPETLETDWLETLLKAAPYLSAESGRVVTTELWSALENNDLPAFARSLMAIQLLNQEALTKAGTPLTYSPDEQAIFEIMQNNGTLAWGRSATGLALYGLIKGARASVELRHKLRHHVGIFGGRVMASITANTGASYDVSDYSLDDNKFKPLRVRT
jgi:predicted sugar kinase